MNSKILVTCGGTACDIRAELGSLRSEVRKVKHDDPKGNVGDFIFKMSASDAVMMKMRYPKVVRVIE